MTMTDVSRTGRFRVVYDEVYDDLSGYCRRRVPPDDVADLLAEAMMVLWQRLDDIPAGDAARPWAYAVTRNLIRNHWRKGRRSEALRQILVDELLSSQQRSGRHADDARLEYDQFEALVDGLHGLRPKEQELIRLVTWEELPHADVAVVLDCSVNAVAIRLLRARARLSDILAKDPRWERPATARSGTIHEFVKGPAPSRQVDVDGRTAAGNDKSASGTADHDVSKPLQPRGCD